MTTLTADSKIKRILPRCEEKQTRLCQNIAQRHLLDRFTTLMFHWHQVVEENYIKWNCLSNRYMRYNLWSCFSIFKINQIYQIILWTVPYEDELSLPPSQVPRFMVHKTGKFDIGCPRDWRWHNGWPLENPQYDSAAMYGGFNWARMMSRDTSFSNSSRSDRCCFSSLELIRE